MKNEHLWYDKVNSTASAAEMQDKSYVSLAIDAHEQFVVKWTRKHIVYHALEMKHPYDKCPDQSSKVMNSFNH